MPDRLRRLLYCHATRILTRPLGSRLRCSGQDIDRLRRHVRKGDVLLVYGDQRISEVIRYLTQSSWSHAAIYVGDEGLRRDPARAPELEARFGEDARHLLVEALVDEGVVLSPLSKYAGFHLRLCRPFGLEPDDVATVLDDVLGQVGDDYDVANLLDLARYFLPVSIVPSWLRRKALELGSGRPTEVICSSMIARAFDAVGFPILPRTADEEAALLADLAPRQSGSGPAEREAASHPRRVYHIGATSPSWPSRRPLAHHLRMSRRPHGLVTPRDFDLSPYFEVVKFSLIEDARRHGRVLESTASADAPRGPAVALRRAAQSLPLWRRLRLRSRAAAAHS